MIAVLRRSLWVAGWPARAVVLGLIRSYRLTLGQMLGGRCRYYPSCSVYAEGVVREWGAVRGSALAMWRLLRCNPLSAGGVDRPPPRAVMYDSVTHPTGSESSPGRLQA